MNVDLHQRMRERIDKSLAGTASADEQQTLREHIVTCAPCQQFLDASNRAIAGLGGFSFASDPELEGKVLASLTLRARQLELSTSYRRMRYSYLAALVLTITGSLAAARCSGLAVALFHLEPASLRIGVLAFWVVPSVCFCLLFPILHRLSVGGSNEKGLSQ